MSACSCGSRLNSAGVNSRESTQSAAPAAEQIGRRRNQAHGTALAVAQRHRDGCALAGPHRCSVASVRPADPVTRRRLRHGRAAAAGAPRQTRPDSRDVVHEIVHLPQQRIAGVRTSVDEPAPPAPRAANTPRAISSSRIAAACDTMDAAGCATMRAERRRQGSALPGFLCRPAAAVKGDGQHLPTRKRDQPPQDAPGFVEDFASAHCVTGRPATVVVP